MEKHEADLYIMEQETIIGSSGERISSDAGITMYYQDVFDHVIRYERWFETEMRQHHSEYTKIAEDVKGLSDGKVEYITERGDLYRFTYRLAKFVEA